MTSNFARKTTLAASCFCRSSRKISSENPIEVSSLDPLHRFEFYKILLVVSQMTSFASNQQASPEYSPIVTLLRRPSCWLFIARSFVAYLVDVLYVLSLSTIYPAYWNVLPLAVKNTSAIVVELIIIWLCVLQSLLALNLKPQWLTHFDKKNEDVLLSRV